MPARGLPWALRRAKVNYSEMLYQQIATEAGLALRTDSKLSKLGERNLFRPAVYFVFLTSFIL